MDYDSLVVRVKRESLYDGLDDWVSLVEAYGLALLADPDAGPDQLKAVVIEVVRQLLAEGMVELGPVERGTGFRAWQEPTEVLIERISDAMRHGDDQVWGYVAWMRNTPKGRDVANSFDPAEFP
jgi:hypothetical protein